MDIQSKKKIAKQYDELVEKHGFDRHSLHCDGARYDVTHQDFKFQFVMDQLAEKDSLLDVGCGLGHLADYCGMQGWKGEYTGLDLSQKMVETTKKRLNMVNIFEKDILEGSYEKKHDVVASIATLQERPQFQEPVIYLEEMINKMFEISTKAIVFDVFSNRFTDFENPNNLYVDPYLFIQTLCNITNNFIIFNHYNSYQMMIVMFKGQPNGWRI
jgi:SAM-dependent methyltransferase